MFSDDEDDEFCILDLLKEANPELNSSLNLIDKAVKAVDAFCQANGKERLPISVSGVKNEAMRGRYEPLTNELTVFIDALRENEWSGDTEGDYCSPYSVLLHEYGHWVHFKWLDHEKIPEGENLLSLRDDLKDNCEMFAETFRVFVDNPNNLKIQNPTRYAWMKKRFKLPKKKYPKGLFIDYDKMGKEGTLLKMINELPDHRMEPSAWNKMLDELNINNE